MVVGYVVGRTVGINLYFLYFTHCAKSLLLSVEKKAATKRNGNKKKEWAKEYEKGVRKVGQDDRAGSTGNNSRRKGREERSISSTNLDRTSH